MTCMTQVFTLSACLKHGLDAGLQMAMQGLEEGEVQGNPERGQRSSRGIQPADGSPAVGVPTDVYADELHTADWQLSAMVITSAPSDIYGTEQRCAVLTAT